MRNKRFFILFLVISVFLSLGGCSRTAEQPSPVVVDEVPPGPEAVFAVMTAAELEDFEVYPELKTLDLSGSICYDAILSFIAEHPGIDVTYTVEVKGNDDVIKISNKDESVIINDASYLENFIGKIDYLPALKKIDLGNCDVSVEQLDSLHDSVPGLIVTYTVDILGQSYPSNTSFIDLSALTPADLADTAERLKKLPALAVVQLNDSEGNSNLSLDDVVTLASACPGAAIDYRFELFGQTVSTMDERLEYVKAEIGDSGVDKIRQILPYMSRLQYLKLDSCGISNEIMAQLRDDFPDIKVVWRVFFNQHNTLTDTEKIWATGTVTDGYTEPLKYCTDVKYLDMGHNCITNINFINYMPKLEVAVLSITWVQDLSPLANCPNLEYLEIFTSRITDLSPLAQCKNLKHLNISNLEGMHDISPLYELENLERMYCTMSSIPKEQRDKFIELHPDCEVNFNWEDPSKGPWRFDENGDRVERYELLAQQFGYDTFDYSW